MSTKKATFVIVIIIIIIIDIPDITMSPQSLWKLNIKC